MQENQRHLIDFIHSLKQIRKENRAQTKDSRDFVRTYVMSDCYHDMTHLTLSAEFEGEEDVQKDNAENLDIVKAQAQ